MSPTPLFGEHAMCATHRRSAATVWYTRRWCPLYLLAWELFTWGNRAAHWGDNTCFNLTVFHSAFLHIHVLPCPLLHSLAHSWFHCQAFPTSSSWLLVVLSKKVANSRWDRLPIIHLLYPWYYLYSLWGHSHEVWGVTRNTLIGQTHKIWMHSWGIIEF